MSEDFELVCGWLEYNLGCPCATCRKMEWDFGATVAADIIAEFGHSGFDEDKYPEWLHSSSTKRREVGREAVTVVQGGGVSPSIITPMQMSTESTHSLKRKLSDTWDMGGKLAKVEPPTSKVIYIPAIPNFTSGLEAEFLALMSSPSEVHPSKLSAIVKKMATSANLESAQWERSVKVKWRQPDGQQHEILLSLETSMPSPRTFT